MQVAEPGLYQLAACRMFSLEQDGWELVLRAVLVYAALLVMVRLSGKRTVGQFTPFDLLVMLLLSESVSNALTGGDESLPGGLLSAGTLILLNGLVALATTRSRRVERLVEGEPVLIGRDGQFFEAVMRRHRVADSDMERALREADCDKQDMACAFLESNGGISVMKKQPPRA